MKKLYDMVHTEKYTDRSTGEEKKKFTNVGAVLQRDDGSMCANFLGSWINFYEPKQRQNNAPQQSQTPPQNNYDDMDGDIPF